MQMFTQSNIEEYVRFAFGSIITIVVAVSSIIITSKFVGPLPISVAQTTTEKTSTFDVTGTSEITMVPDQAEVSVGITVNQRTVAGAQNQANQIITSITQNVKNLGIDEQDIKTVNFNINPSYNYDNEPATINGYNVSTSVRITVKDLDNINQVIDTATANGANQVNNISFSLSKEKQDQAREQARKEAIEDAKNSAKELANLSGVKLGKIIDVDENTPSTDQPPVQLFRAEAANLDTAESTSINPGSSTYNYQVTLSYETL